MVVAVAAVAVVAVAAVTVVAVAAVAGPQRVVRVALHLCTFWLLGVVVGLVAWILPAILWPPPPPPRVLHTCTPAPLVTVVAWVLHVAWLVGLVACIGVMVGLVAWVAGVLEVLPKSHCKPLLWLLGVGVGVVRHACTPAPLVVDPAGGLVVAWVVAWVLQVALVVAWVRQVASVLWIFQVASVVGLVAWVRQVASVVGLVLWILQVASVGGLVAWVCQVDSVWLGAYMQALGLVAWLLQVALKKSLKSAGAALPSVVWAGLAAWTLGPFLDVASTKIRASSDLSDTATSLSLTAKVTGCWGVQRDFWTSGPLDSWTSGAWWWGLAAWAPAGGLGPAGSFGRWAGGLAPAGGFGGGAGGLGPAGIPFLQAPLAKQTQSLFPRRPTLISF